MKYKFKKSDIVFYTQGQSLKELHNMLTTQYDIQINYRTFLNILNNLKQSIHIEVLLAILNEMKNINPNANINNVLEIDCENSVND